jgi:hypothetical protein
VKREKKLIIIKAKDCSQEIVKFELPEQLIVKKISGILQFTAYDGFRISFDILSTLQYSIDELIAYVEKKYREDIAQWITARLWALKQFINANKVEIPTCLKDEGELTRRIVIGILYAIRPYITLPVILDDLLSFVVNEVYRESFIAMMRPFIVSVNRYLDSRDLLQFNPIVIVPGGAAGFYRLSDPQDYVIIFDDKKWKIGRREIEKLLS